MSIKTALINSNTPNKGTKPQDFEVNLLGTSFLTTGFIPHSQTDSNIVCEETSPAGMSVKIGKKSYFIEVERAGNPASFEKFKVLVHILQEEEIAIPANSSGGELKGALILRTLKTAIDTGATPSDDGLSETSLEYLVGTSATALTDAEIQAEIGSDFFLRLADISVADGATEITDSEISITVVQCLTEVFVSKTGDETIDGEKTFSIAPKTAQDPVGDDDVIRKGWYDLNAGLPAEINRVADESIAINNPVYLGNDNKLRKSGDFEHLDFPAPSNSLKNQSVVHISSDIYATFSSDENNIYMTVYNINEETGADSNGVQHTILSGVAHTGMDAIEVADDKIFCIWDASGVHRAKCISFSGNTPSIPASATTMNSGFEEDNQLFLTKVSEDLLCVGGKRASDHKGVFYKITFSGTTPSSSGITQSYTGTSNYQYPSKVVGIENDCVFVITPNKRTSDAATLEYNLKVFDISGAPSELATYTQSTPNRVAAYTVRIDDNIVSIILNANAGGYAHQFTHGINILTSVNGLGAMYSAWINSIDFDYHYLGNGRGVMIYNRNATYWEIRKWEKTVSGAFPYKTESGITASGEKGVGVRVFGYDKVLIAKGLNNQETRRIYRDIHFFAKGAVVKDENLQAVGLGGFLTTEAGLIPGQMYYSQNKACGVNVSDTSVLITYNPNPDN